MGWFRKKKTEEEILAEGRVQFESGDLRHAFMTVHGLAQKGNPEACEYIGVYWLQKGDRPSDRRIAERYLITAAKGGRRDAAVLLAEAFDIQGYLNELDASVPDKSVTFALEESIADVQEEAVTVAPEESVDEATCGQWFQNGLAAYEAEDFVKALLWYEKAAEQGDLDAQLNCARMYERGIGTETDNAKALLWYERAAEQGDINAQCICGMSYAGDGSEADNAKALSWYEKAAEQGDDIAQYICATMYQEGRGTEKDGAKALLWYKKAAEQGDVSSQLNCARLYEEGIAIQADKAEAFAWYKKAAEQGSDVAKFKCACMYFNGEGIRKNRKTAKKLFEEVARWGDKDLQERAKEYLRTHYKEDV